MQAKNTFFYRTPPATASDNGILYYCVWWSYLWCELTILTGKKEFVRMQEFVTQESWLLLIGLFDMLTRAIKFYKFHSLPFQRDV